MKLDINNSSLSDEIWACLIENFLYETKSFNLLFDNEYNLETVSGIYSEGYSSVLKLKNTNLVYFFKYKNNNLYWRYQQSSVKEEAYVGFIPLYMSYLECSYKTALKSLKENFLSFCNYRNIDEGFSLRHDERYSHGDNFVPPSIIYKNENFIKNETYNYYSTKGDLLGAIVKYKSESNYFELPFFIEKFELSGMSNRQFVHMPDIYFKYYNCNYSVFSAQRKIIFMCDDFILAERLNFIIHESKNINFKNRYYALSFKYLLIKSRIEVISDFENYEIIYIPSANKESFREFLSFMNKTSFKYDVKIYKSTVFVDDGSCIDLEFNNPDLFENFLMQNVASANYIDPQCLERMYYEAVDFDEFEKWSRTIGLVSQNSSDNYNGLVDLIDFMKSININVDNSEKEYNWDKFFTPQNINLVVAPSHSGKTFFLLSITYFLSLGLGSFGFKAKNKYKVLYLDGESTDEYFGQMMTSLISEVSHIDSRQSSAFHPHLFKQYRGDLNWDFSNDAFKNKVTEWISNGINLVVIDNLNSLAKRFVTSSSKWDSFIDWIDFVQKKYSTAFILAHHSNKNWETLGLESVEGKSHNVIQLFAGNSILNQFEFQHESDRKNIKFHINDNNFVVGINFKKCQSFINLQDTKHVYFRKRSSIISNNKWDKIYPDDRNESDEVDRIISNEDLDLSIRLLNYAKKNKRFNAAEVQKFFSVSRSKITLCLNAHLGNGIKRLGSGRSTMYIYSLDD